MLFAVRMDVDIPTDLAPDDRAALLATEKAYSHELQRAGKWMWAVSRILDSSSWLWWSGRGAGLVVGEGFGGGAVAEAGM